MIITKRTKTKKVLPLITQSNFKRLFDMVPEVEYKSILSMTISEFAELTEDEAGYIEREILRKEKYFLNAFGKMKHLKKQIERLGKFMEKMTRKQSADEIQAAKGVLFPNFIQRMMIDVVKFFNLKSFDEAEKIKISDWVLIFQNESAQNIYQSNYQKIIDQKTKNKSKRK